MPAWLATVDRAVLAALVPLAIAILICGLDDLVVDVFWACAWLKDRLRPSARMFPPGEKQLASARHQRIAILLPLWHEHEVIGKMLEHNLASIRYPDYHIFAGCYPNDADTQSAVLDVARRLPNIHVAVCPHDGPTSKADCLNWAFQHLLLAEESAGVRFDVVIVHDAEDMIHPEELRWMNFYSARFDFIQTPVLPLPTPLTAWTHGIYCDEFAEYHTRDMTVRPISGGFLPSCGVGTGYRRDALENLARTSSNQIFEPGALTEDYANGLRMFRLGAKQAFIRLYRARHGAQDLVATREFFPQRFGAALRQRTRWVTGIALQGWQQFGWKGKPGEVYWLWRDRKGLIANPLSLIANAVFAYGLATQLWTRVSPAASRLAAATMALQLIRLGVRITCSARVYGFVFALGAPLRNVYANFLNSAATLNAVRVYAIARWHGKPLKWLKTDHAYPTRAALLSHKRRLGEILVGAGQISAATLAHALESMPPGARLGEHLVASGLLTIDALYDTLSFQQGLPRVQIVASEITPAVAHALPVQVAQEWEVLPFRIAEGHLMLASPEAPTPEATRALTGFTSLDLKFHLITPAEFERLISALL